MPQTNTIPMLTHYTVEFAFLVCNRSPEAEKWGFFKTKYILEEIKSIKIFAIAAHRFLPNLEKSAHN